MSLMRSPIIKVLVLALTSLLFSTGAGGGCGGGTPEPTIEVPAAESPCPQEMPDPWSPCDLGPDESCSYEKITCCDEEGLEGNVTWATHAQCADGSWLIAMAGIYCEYGYWPDSCSN
jgi:hypothetical protein